MENIERSVVQVIADHYDISYSYPWSFIGKYSSTGSGFCILWKDKKYILTNAHCVKNSNDVVLRRRGFSETFAATILWIVHECDLALLDVCDKNGKKIEKFWSDMLPLELGNMPNKLDKIYVYGYPLGGFNISVTKGVVSRIQIIKHSHGLTAIAIQVDAAINFGNSGGPVVDKTGKIVGVSFAGENDSTTQNMGYIIPPIIVEYFLQSIPKKIEHSQQFAGLCDLELFTQSLDNETLQKYIELPKDKTGILVTGVSNNNASSKYIKQGDVIMYVDGKQINNDGTMFLSDLLSIYGNTTNLGTDEIILYHNYIHLKNPGDSIELTLWRKKKEKTVKFTIEQNYFPVPRFEHQSSLSYFILMGMVFLPISYPLIKEKNNNQEYVCHLVELVKYCKKFEKDEQVIILSDIFASKFTEGYPVGNFILDSINNVKVKNMRHLIEVVKKQIESSEILIFNFKDRDVMIILNSSDIKKYDRSIREENIGSGVPSFAL